MRVPGGDMRLLILTGILAMASMGCTHTQRPERRTYVVAEDAHGVGTALGTGGAGDDDCQRQHEECVKQCWKKRYPWPHHPNQSGWYYQRCVSDCGSQYNDCVK